MSRREFVPGMVMAVSSRARRLAAAGLVKTLLLVSSALAASVMAANVMAWSTEDVSVRSTIVVTGVRQKGTGSGTKTDTSLMATPQTITVIAADERTRRHARSLNQALTYVAGISPNQR